MDNERPTPPPAQQALPFDDEADRPVPFALTARARREVAPDALPDLEVVRPGASAREDMRAGDRDRPFPAAAGANDADRPLGSRAGPIARVRPAVDRGALDEPADTRPSRARALRRAGVGIAQIARQLGVDELAVRAWVGDLGGRGSVGRGPASSLVALPGVPATAPRQDPSVRRRERAREQGRARLRHEPGFAAGLGLLVGAADIDDHGVGLRTSDPRVAASAIGWLVEYGGLPLQRVRVVLRLGAKVAGDRARHSWSSALGLPLEQLTHTRWRGAPDDEAEEALLHVTDEELAARLAGWVEALLEPAPAPVDAAF
jgi:transposase-like protein